MDLKSGDKLGPYEISSVLGKGGMGAVYRANDHRLRREVAIKVSAERFCDRFEREARAVAALNHQNVCALFDIGPHYLVMELVEGETLAERIKQGAMPLDEALAVAKQIACALEAAHEKGITHRDLKPGNVMVRRDGTVKVLDFGLAKMAEPASSGVNPSQSPTITMDGATKLGAILGTAGYMAPEQVKGENVDHRADIWAFGVVFYEMLTGTRLFEGETASETMAAILVKEPDLALAPARLQRLLRRCLAKDPKKRLCDIGDVWELLDEEQRPVPAPVTAGSPRWLAIAAGIPTLLLAGLAFTHFREKPPEGPVVRTAIPAPSACEFAPNPETALSPDGRRLVFLASSGEKVFRLYVRSLDNPEAQPLAGTEGAGLPFWSPDSQFIGFASHGNLRKVAASGGPVLTLSGFANVNFNFRGGSWGADGTIVFAPFALGPLKKIAASGGAVEDATSLDSTPGSTTHRWPWFLPDGRHFLYIASAFAGAEGEIRVGSLDASERAGLANKSFGKTNAQAAFSRGYLLFLRGQTLLAQPFDTKNFTVTGEAVTLADHIAISTGALSTRFAVSNELLAFQKGETRSYTLVWFDGAGKRTGTVGDPGGLFRLHLSPDRKMAAVSITEAGNQDIWLYDLARNLRTRFTSDPAAEAEAVWSPDGKTIVFNSSRKGHYDLYRKAANGTGAEELLYADGVDKSPESWSPDGKYVFYERPGSVGDTDIYALPMTEGGKPYPFLNTKFGELFPQFSPDGRWVAYASNESGRNEVYVTPFPGPGPKRQVSLAGGAVPRWKADGRELFYIAPGETLMAAGINLKGKDPEVDAPRPLFTGLPTGGGFQYDVSADGRHFLAVAPPENTGPPEPLTLVQNWMAGLKK